MGQQQISGWLFDQNKDILQSEAEYNWIWATSTSNWNILQKVKIGFLVDKVIFLTKVAVTTKFTALILS